MGADVEVSSSMTMTRSNLIGAGIVYLSTIVVIRTCSCASETVHVFPFFRNMITLAPPWLPPWLSRLPVTPPQVI